MSRRRSARSAARWSASTTRPGWTSWPAAWPPPASRSSPPAPPRRSSRDAGIAGHPGRGAHRLPGVPRRAGQDAAPARARRPAGRPARSPTTSRSSSELGIEPFELVVVQPLPVHARRSPPARRPTSASSRSTSAGRRWCAPRPRTTPRSRSSSTPARYATCSRRCAPAASRSSSGRRWPLEAFRHTATYDIAVAIVDRACRARRRRAAPRAGSAASLAARRRAALRREPAPAGRALLDPAAPAGLAQAEQLHGKEMSYNNYVDADAAWRAAARLRPSRPWPIIKHANPCGIAVGADVAEAHRKAHACDPVSAFGGVIAVNRPVTLELAEQIADIFTEVVVAPAYADGAVELLPSEEEHPAARRAAPAPRGRRVPAGQRRRAAADRATGSTRPATTRRPGRSPPARRAERRRWPISRSPGGRCAR